MNSSKPTNRARGFQNKKAVAAAAAKQVATLTTREWMTMTEAAAEANQSKPVLYEWIARGWIDSFLLKSRPDSQSGKRTIRRASLLAFLEKQFREQQGTGLKSRIPVRKKEVPA